MLKSTPSADLTATIPNKTTQLSFLYKSIFVYYVFNHVLKQIASRNTVGIVRVCIVNCQPHHVLCSNTVHRQSIGDGWVCWLSCACVLVLCAAD